MSTHIVDELVAIRFPVASLRSHVGSRRSWEDSYLVFKLGGDNNVYTTHPVTRAEVRSRSWEIFAIGSAREVMTKAVHYSASCEGGMLRLSKVTNTTPESYIRYVRKSLAHAIPSSQALSAGLTVGAEIRCARSDENADHFDLLTSVKIPQNVDGESVWHLAPLYDAQDAAILFEFHCLDKRLLWKKISVYGEQFGWRHPVLQAA